MRVFANVSKMMSLVGAAGLLTLGVGACGDDGGSDPADARVVIDAFMADADDTDAAVPDADVADLRAGTIAVTQIQISNDLTALGIADGTVNGAGVSVSYVDLTSATVAPAVGNNGIGECTVFVYDVGTNGPMDEVSEGNVSISGTGMTPNPFPGCIFVPPLEEYVCGTSPAAVPANTAVDHSVVSNNAFSVLTVPGMDFQALKAKGMAITIGGFTNTTNNGNFMIVATKDDIPSLDANQVQIVNFTVAGAVGADLMGGGDGIAVADGFDETIATPAATDIYAVVAGAGPVIGAYSVFNDYTQDITVAKAAGGLLDAFSVNIKPSGDTLALSTSSKLPHQFDVAATGNVNQVFTCDDGTDGSCGNNGANAGISQIVGWTLAGSTTDGSLTTGCNGGACLPIQMPDPVTQWASFTCKGSPGSSSITLTAAALDAIMGTSPTRIQTRLLRVTADITSAAPTSIIAGKGYIGFMDVPAP